MTSYRRLKSPGGTFFFTVALEDHQSTLLLDHVDVLRQAYAVTVSERPVQTDAIVVLPDHLHAIWTLPSGDADYSTRWRLIKSRFSRAVGLNRPRCLSQQRKSERGIWQRRFWEHMIRDQADLALHMRYCWQNPVKHGLVTQATDWASTSLHRDIRRGLVGASLVAEIPEGEFGEPKQGWVQAPILRGARNVA